MHRRPSIVSLRRNIRAGFLQCSDRIDMSVPCRPMHRRPSIVAILAETSAPASFNALIASTCPFDAAECIGVHPSLSLAETSAPASFNALIASTCPFDAAECIGVHPWFILCRNIRASFLQCFDRIDMSIRCRQMHRRPSIVVLRRNIRTSFLQCSDRIDMSILCCQMHWLPRCYVGSISQQQSDHVHPSVKDCHN